MHPCVSTSEWERARQGGTKAGHFVAQPARVATGWSPDHSLAVNCRRAHLLTGSRATPNKQTAAWGERESERVRARRASAAHSIFFFPPARGLPEGELARTPTTRTHSHGCCFRPRPALGGQIVRERGWWRERSASHPRPRTNSFTLSPPSLRRPLTQPPQKHRRGRPPGRGHQGTGPGPGVDQRA